MYTVAEFDAEFRSFNEGEINYREIYRLFNSATPLDIDCAVLCNRLFGKTCCHGSAFEPNGGGMKLFPFEEGFLDKDFTVKNALILCSDGEEKGSCNRLYRPLSCRIFPLFPTLQEVDGGFKITVKYDLRAFAFCPLVKYQGDFRINPNFVRKVRESGQMISRHLEGRRFLLSETKEIEELAIFHKGFRHPICRRLPGTKKH